MIIEIIIIIIIIIIITMKIIIIAFHYFRLLEFYQLLENTFHLKIIMASSIHTSWPVRKP